MASETINRHAGLEKTTNPRLLDHMSAPQPDVPIGDGAACLSQ
jgi:hypothetical protein